MASAAVAGGAGAGAGILPVKKKQIGLLFDVDGTLIIGPGKVNKKALQFAYNIKKKFPPEQYEIKCLLFTARQTVVSDFTYFTDYFCLRSIGHTHEQAKERLLDFQRLIAAFKKHAGLDVEVASIYDNKVGEYYQAANGLLACDQMVFSQIDELAKDLMPEHFVEIQRVLTKYPELKLNPLALWNQLEARGLCPMGVRSKEVFRLLTESLAIHEGVDVASRTTVGQDASTKAHMLRRVLQDCYGIDRADHPALEGLLVILHEDSQTVFAGLNTCKDPLVRRVVDTQMVIFDETPATEGTDWDIKARWDYFRYHPALIAWRSRVSVVIHAAAAGAASANLLGTVSIAESPVPGAAASPTVWQQAAAAGAADTEAASPAP